LVDPKIAEHRGRIVKTTGDGMLAEFASVVDAVRCAVEIQRGMVERNAAVPHDKRIEYRIGINLGDIIIDGGDIFGDGVNVAARLEGLADANGICVSRVVHDQVRDKLDLAFEDLGEQQVKNIARPIHVFRIALERSRTSAKPTLALPDKPSIAVLPFENMSAEQDQEFFADGLTEDIITALSRISALFVIARNSTFTYKGKATNVRDLGRDLGVRYVLEGSVRKLGTRLRITGQLVEAATGNHVWAEKYDRDVADLFDIQDEITRNVAASVDTQIRLAEGDSAAHANPTEIQVWSLAKQAIRLIYELTEEPILRAKGLAEQALALAPNSGLAHQALSLAIDHLTLVKAMRGLPPEQDRLDEALHHALRAVQLNQNDEYSHWVLGNAYFRLRDYDRSIAAHKRALEINPSCPLASGVLGGALLQKGEPQGSIPYTEFAIRSNPRDPSVFFRYTNMARAHLMLGNYQTALEWTEKAIVRKPQWPGAYLVAAACWFHLNKMDEGRKFAERYLAIVPTGSLSHAKSFFAITDAATLDGLRQLGLPE
jgi:adenylate cyclase